MVQTFISQSHASQNKSIYCCCFVCDKCTSLACLVCVVEIASSQLLTSYFCLFLDHIYRPTYCNKYGAIAQSFQQARISYINHPVCHVHLAAVSVVNLHYNVSASSKYRNYIIPTDRDGGEQVIRSSKSYEIQSYQPVNLIVSHCSSLFSSNFILLFSYT